MCTCAALLLGGIPGRFPEAALVLLCIPHMGFVVSCPGPLSGAKRRLGVGRHSVGVLPLHSEPAVEIACERYLEVGSSSDGVASCRFTALASALRTSAVMTV